jgi:hypothetical protein
VDGREPAQMGRPQWLVENRGWLSHRFGPHQPRPAITHSLMQIPCQSPRQGSRSGKTLKPRNCSSFRSFLPEGGGAIRPRFHVATEANRSTRKPALGRFAPVAIAQPIRFTTFHGISSDYLPAQAGTDSRAASSRNFCRLTPADRYNRLRR